MTFNDFTQSGLVGQTVLYERDGFKCTATITFANSKYFTIANPAVASLDPKTRFGWDGFEKGTKAWGVSSRCTLITPEQAAEYRRQWAINKHVRTLKDEIAKKLETITDPVTLTKINAMLS